MASTSTPRPNPTPPEMTFYMLGRRLPSGTFTKSLTDGALATATQSFSNLAPTTYEAAKAYLDAELLKPEGQRDLLREMCMIMVGHVPNDQEVFLINKVPAGTLWELATGTIMIMPTLDNPPTAFGTVENPTSSRLVNRKSSEPARAYIALAYFTRIGDKDRLDYIGQEADVTQLDYVHYR